MREIIHGDNGDGGSCANRAVRVLFKAIIKSNPDESSADQFKIHIIVTIIAWIRLNFNIELMFGQIYHFQ